MAEPTVLCNNGDLVNTTCLCWRKKMNGAEHAGWQWVTNTLLLCAQQQTIQVLLWRVSCQHYTININNREKARCPEGHHSQVHELKMSPISSRKGEQGNSMALNSFLHKTNFTLREIISNDSRVWTDCQQEWEQRDKHLSRATRGKRKRWKKKRASLPDYSPVTSSYIHIQLTEACSLTQQCTIYMYIYGSLSSTWASSLTTGQFEPSNMKLTVCRVVFLPLSSKWEH